MNKAIIFCMILSIIFVFGCTVDPGTIHSENMLPEDTVFKPPITNAEFAKANTDGTIEVTLTNHAGEEIGVNIANANIQDLIIDGKSVVCSNVRAEINSASENIKLNNGEQFNFKWICEGVEFKENNFIKGTLTLEYVNLFINKNKIHSGTINVIVGKNN